MLIPTLIAGLIFSAHAGDDVEASLQLYREMSLRVRPYGKFQVPMPGAANPGFSYELKFAKPKFDRPLHTDFVLDESSHRFIRRFWDRIFLEDGSVLSLGTDQVPLTCVFIQGQDNRFSEKDTPLVPDFVLRVYLVANDFTCTGPLNPGWPENGGRRETWDTYLHFEVRDPTVMLPTDTLLRYRWNEMPAVLMDEGGRP